jgi:hypothetical protein
MLALKERLLDFSVNADQPFFRMSGAVAKIICLCFKFASSFLRGSQFGRKASGNAQAASMPVQRR